MWFCLDTGLISSSDYNANILIELLTYQFWFTFIVAINFINLSTELLTCQPDIVEMDLAAVEIDLVEMVEIVEMLDFVGTDFGETDFVEKDFVGTNFVEMLDFVEIVDFVEMDFVETDFVEMVDIAEIVGIVGLEILNHK